jgi:Recombinase
VSIRHELNRRGIEAKGGGPWSRHAVSELLRNEAYMGNLVYNRWSERLGAKRTLNPTNLWVRSEGCIQPIIDRNVFQRAQERMESRRVKISEEEMLVVYVNSLCRKAG